MIQCEFSYYRDGTQQCRVAEGLIDGALGVPTSAPACRQCYQDPHPRQPNRVTVGIAIAALRRNAPDLLEELKPSLLARLKAGTSHSLVAKARRYTASTMKWFAAGCPVRTDEEVKHILALCQANICGAYESLSANEGACRECGCALNLYGGLMNKIRRATEHCPKEYW